MVSVNHVATIDIENLLDILATSEYYDGKDILRRQVFEGRELLKDYIELGIEPNEELNRQIEDSRSYLIYELAKEICVHLESSRIDSRSNLLNDIYWWLDSGDFENYTFESLLMEYQDMLDEADKE